MSYVIDRRLNGKNKSAVNRQRFMRRYRDHIKRAVTDAVSQRSITDMDRGENITIPNKDISEPRFSHGKGGERNIIQPGNQEFIAGDRIPRQSGGEGQGNQASNQGEGIDDFVFQISQAEFLEYMFEDLELPNLVKKHLIGIESFKMVHGGIIDEGLPSRINIIRSMRSAYGRRLALTGSSRRRIKLLQKEYSDLQEKEPKSDYDKKCLADLEEQINKLKSHIKKIPYIDDFDLKYNVRVKKPKPTSKAVMFCIMDVSGSMNQATKDIAKRFFILLYLFLKRNYEKTEVVFIRHHISAKEVDEHEFFYSRETGGTIVSSALKKMDEIIQERYPASEWNIYSAQASDGDNWNDDSPLCRTILTERILPLVQYFAYIEITPRDHQALWREYEKILETHGEAFALRQIVEINDIYPVFRDLFQRKYTK